MTSVLDVTREATALPLAGPAGSIPDEATSHLDLLVAIGGLQRVAMDGDAAVVRTALDELRGTLAVHVEEERAMVAHLPAVMQQLVTAGQRRLFDILDRLVDAAEAGCGGSCLARSVELRRELTRQARLEAGLLGSVVRR